MHRTMVMGRDGGRASYNGDGEVGRGVEFDGCTFGRICSVGLCAYSF